MLFVSSLQWWYTTGWLMLVCRVSGRVQGALQFFSVGQLAGSLFAPYRQISAGRVQGSVEVLFRAWADRLFSRIIGAVVRLLLIICGLAFALTVSLLGVTAIVVWPLLPIFPIIGFMLSMTKVTP